MSNHTPGPWKVEENYGKLKDEPPEATKLCFHSIVAGNETLASTWARPHGANARLMATAPEMLEALISASNELTHLGQSPTLVALIDQVVAKATSGAV